MSTKSIIITAGGIGKRMGSDLPKQFIEVNGKPIILHSVSKFLGYDPRIEIIVVLPANYIPLWEEICQKYFFTSDHKVVVGGAERFHSIQNGLKEVTKEFVGVHDAVRPMINVTTIADCFNAAEEFGAAIPVIGVSESLRKKEGSTSVSVNREDYILVQTPQCFKTEILRKAYSQPYSKLFTDDASVVEADGYGIHLVNGHLENSKITTPHDLKLAALFLK